ncbi:iron uptake porin [Coleofasciculus sp. FACHB-1120]|uniref:iron uptake porin n=1 Tax=Coleofasciculus sp. FACHB-1120 TaxID=2692783 RepID=UPI001684A4A1|nr:iron uptake porin [Coleofasciculus sp. FACHB-1120]MBD2740580.1 iron uptake porin [Coleofasciculus sp. FACHB-1120]
MSKILWNTLKLGPTILGASLLVCSSTLAAQTSDTQMASEPITATNQVTDLLKPADQSPQAQQTPVQELVVQPEVSSIPVFSNSKSAQQTPVAEAELVSPKPVLADNAIAQPTADAVPTSQNSEVLEQLDQYTNEAGTADSMDQVTNVSQLQDVEPTDWAYEALRSLVERYGCIAGYPDGTFRGNRALSRYEFAAGMNACLLQIEKLIAASSADFVTKEDLATLQRLIDEFGAELATLRTRVDNLEGRTAFLESHQFSTTTKLTGEVIFALADVFGEEKAGGGDVDANLIFADRARLNFDTTFTGKDRLRTRLQARNIVSFGTDITGTNMTRLGFDGDNQNDVAIDDFFYRFPIGDKLLIQIDAANVEFNDNVYTFNPNFESSGSGSISRFGRFNPIYRLGSDGTGLTATYNFSKALNLSLGYLAPRGNDPSNGSGEFSGAYAGLAQLVFRPSDALNLGLVYAHTYENEEKRVSFMSSTGSRFANQPFGNIATSGNHYGLNASFRFGPGITLSGWAGYSVATAEISPAGLATTGSNADIWNWAVSLAFPDLGKKGNLLGFIFGMPPKVTDNDVSNRSDQDTSYHVEALYRYRLTDNIDLTPGLLVILNPEHNDNNDTLYVGTLRTTFKF